ncbi:hypothetical protein V2J09_013873 [Rumex salicifolius]
MSPSIVSAALNLYCTEDNATIFEEVESGVVSELISINPQLIPLESDYRILSFLVLSPLQREEFLDDLFKREIQHLPCKDYLKRFRSSELDSNARKKAIDWITKVHSHYNFGPLTWYLSINYMDRFLSTYELPENVWIMQLLAVACLSLAAKVEEVDVPLSLDFQIGKPRFVFEAKTIQEMELLVLNTLEWRMQSVTPFNFLDYFLYKIFGDQMPPMCFLSRATQLIISTTKGIDFLEFMASEIAAAVIISVAVETQTIQDIYKAICLVSGRLKEEVVIKCVKMIQSSSSMTAIRSDYEINGGGSVSSVLECPTSLSSRMDDAVAAEDDDGEFSANSKLDCSVRNSKMRKLI